MEHEKIKQLASEVGLVFSGYNSDGEPEFIGTQKQWSDLENLKIIEENEKLDNAKNMER